ncbi:MAG: VWA domain-containing protein [Gammaproteobacteria bacterium]|nr:VWA domain-containing protein [Gammaproteobacteria bacterium]
MIHFEWPWLAVLLPLPWLARLVLQPALRPRDAALRVPFLRDFIEAQAGPESTQRRPGWLLLLAALAWILLVGASMRPEWLGDLVDIPVSGRDLMLAVDLSGSMQEEDFVLGGRQVDRLTATKRVAGEFIERRVGDRIGLILFGEQAYLQAPLTFDRDTVRTFLDESAIGLAGKATAIGDAIGLAVKRLRGRDQENRVLILLTDGANTAGVVEPLEAAELAAGDGLRIHTIGVGADEMVVRDFFGFRNVNPSAELDEEALKAIAAKTGGRYFRARDTNELEEIYRLLDELEPVAGDPRRFRPRSALFHVPLALALLLSALLLSFKISARIP